MCVCGVQIARREVLKVSARIHKLNRPTNVLRVTNGVNVVVQSETMLGTESNSE